MWNYTEMLTGWLKMLDVKMTDQFAGHEIAKHENAGHEHDGPKWRQGVKFQEKQYSFNRDIITMKCANF